jgi:hypothetical protein
MLLATTGSLVALLGGAGVATASDALSQGFTTSDASLETGSLVAVRSNTHGVVEKATSSHAPQLVGIIADRPLIALGGGSDQVQVVVSGVATALVSDINGQISTGDKITASPIEGVGMKAALATEIIGTAESNLKDSHTITQTVTDITGKKTTVHMGAIDVRVNVSYYAPPQDKLNAIVPTFLVNLGSSIAGKDLSPMRVLTGFGCLLLGFMVAGIMLQAGVRSGIISLGRNPLAHNFLRRGLLDVLITSVAVLGITAVAFYLILTA